MTDRRISNASTHPARKESFFSAMFEYCLFEDSSAAIYILLGHDFRYLCKSIPLISAPALKNRPSPVRTVNTVLGCSSSSRNAEIVSSISLPPKAFRVLGRFSCTCSVRIHVIIENWKARP